MVASFRAADQITQPLLIIVGLDPTIFSASAKKMLASSASMMRIKNCAIDSGSHTSPSKLADA
jgi:hypothetical protein